MLNHLIDESRIEAINDQTIETDPNALANFDMVNTALNALDRLIQRADWKTEAKLTVLRLGVRIFNAAGAGLKTARAGYYQPAFGQVRDILETSYLLDYFKEDPTQIDIWIKTKADYKRFRPSEVRRALEKTDTTKVPRQMFYSQFCEYATHPTPQGFVIISPNEMITQRGPFPDADRIKAFLVDLAVHLTCGTFAFGGHVRGRNTVENVREKWNLMRAAHKWSKDRLPSLHDRLAADLPKLEGQMRELDRLIELRARLREAPEKGK